MYRSSRAVVSCVSALLLARGTATLRAVTTDQQPSPGLCSTRFAGAAGGSTFRYTQTCNVLGNAADIGSIGVRLANQVGTSPAASGSYRQP